MVNCGHLDLSCMPERLADVMRRARVFNRDVMFGNDYFQLNDKPIDDALQWHNIA